MHAFCEIVSGRMTYEDKPNIFIFMLDTVRASDSYGDSSLRTINYIGRNGIRYNNAIAPGTWTATSHASIFSGKYVSKIPEASKDMFKNGTSVIDPWFVKTKFLDKGQETMASRLSVMGYSSTLISNNPFVNSFTNLSNGFGKCYDLWAATNVSNDNLLTKNIISLLKGGFSTRIKLINAAYAVSRVLPRPIVDRAYLNLRLRMARNVADADNTYNLDRGAKRTNSVIRDHIKQASKFDILPEFMFINYMEAHENYPVPDKNMVQDKWVYLSGIMDLDSTTLRKLHSGYLKRLRYLDAKVGEAIEILKRAGKLDDAIVIVTSDHGQFFGEHGLLYHSQFPYSEVSRVPTVSARFKNSRIIRDRKEEEAPISLTQMQESIMDVVGGRSDNLYWKAKRIVFTEHTGISEGWDEYLLRKLKRRSKYADLIYKAKESHNQNAVSIYSEKFKLVHFHSNSKAELYSIADTDESENLIDSKRAYAKQLLERYKRAVAG